jgi:hypothetical protein
VPGVKAGLGREPTVGVQAIQVQVKEVINDGASRGRLEPTLEVGRSEGVRNWPVPDGAAVGPATVTTRPPHLEGRAMAGLLPLAFHQNQVSMEPGSSPDL